MINIKQHITGIALACSLICNVVVVSHILKGDCHVCNFENYIPKDTCPDPDWQHWEEGSMFAYGFPDKSIPSVYKMAGRGPLYNDGMYVAQCGNNTRWNQNNFPHGGLIPGGRGEEG